ncbi:nucleobase-ascorbate transporter 12 [Physcomitrium patens]|uniref:Uncharacterized protein n=1 Tax=Physcomitrium patens TaxID=3218 RepID=A0A2K1KTR7_PHYPA|nr:nucleobase-ascorbate transporter 12-like [Physcomitrium patens]XP_024372016.1 nucleobase-ascorbate transporter 12-like [Physcomitrium patens]XP_024372017.1 nucleobase-ascorbate transporter 12-like [Physcomitrium patens]XP_024372018.1 nucleobase-ascorbate transporter 12-like [Physcomitrium patens]PNR57150.1 hypothetical protein PHYPA_004143 [Physcomitrium patens]|eukprot:XP_024372015.1 nucleobase-ascorbate transporter 12-like [Physcomitrella patens]
MSAGMPGSPPLRISQTRDHDPESPSLGKRPGLWPTSNNGQSNNSRATMGSWARRTGFKGMERGTSNGSDIEINLSDGTHIPKNPKFVSAEQPTPPKDLESGAAPKGVRAGVQANGTKEGNEKSEGVPSKGATRGAPGPFNPAKAKAMDSDASRNSSGQLRIEPLRVFKEQNDDVMSQSEGGEDQYVMSKHAHMKYELRETPGLVPLILYGIQHYFSIVGSLLLIPLIIVPAMGGTPEDSAKVVSSVLMVSGISTLLHTSFGSRLPLIQGASFVYLAPALAIIFSHEFSSLTEDRFKKTMRELQGAIIIGSAFQALLGYSGAMSLLLRAINPVVVAPTLAAVGLAFFAYGFPVVGRCVEIGIPQILLLVLFALYLRKITIFDHRIFQVYAVPLGLALTWAFAFLLTESKVYTYSGCSFSQQGNMTAVLTPKCQEKMATMRSCRTDVSNALSTSAWFRFPYPFQWGVPTFHWQTAAVMMVASVIASVDSVGAYHASSLLVASRAPTPGVVSRSIGLEGLTSILAGIWGIGTGATTLTENVHTIAVTKMGSRRPVEFGACILIAASLIGKISGFIASIPQVIVAGLLVFMWTMLAAMGFSTLRYSETGSSRNVLIVGLSLFLSLSIPSYFQQYDSDTSSILPIYFQPYNVDDHGPFQTSNKQANFALNTIFSLHMVVAFLVAFVLDNTVPGSRQERGLYVWSRGRTARNEPAVVKDYGLPFGLSRYFSWVRWVGL